MPIGAAHRTARQSAGASGARGARARGRSGASAARRTAGRWRRTGWRTRSSRVKPGIVLISFSTIVPSGSRKKSMRAMPARSQASKAAIDVRWMPARLLGRQARGDDDVRAALDVLRLEVVPLVVRHDLADRRRDRRLVAEHAALHLAAVDEPLDEHLVVVPERQRAGPSPARPGRAPSRCRRSSRGGPASRTRAGRARSRCGRAAPGRPDRRGAPAASATARWRCRRRAARPCRRTCPSRAPSRARRRRRRARRAISHSPCTVPSSPNGPCSIGSTTSTSSARAGGGRHDRARGAGQERGVAGRRQLPATLTADLDRQHLEARGIERRDHRRGRGERDVVLRRPPSLKTATRTRR